MFKIHLTIIATLVICAAVSIAGDKVDEVDYEPRLLLVGITDKGLSLPEGRTSAPYGACQVSPEISDVLGMFGPETVSRVFKNFDPEKYTEFEYMPPMEVFHSIRFAGDFDVFELIRMLEEVPDVLFAEPNYYFRFPDQEPIHDDARAPKRGAKDLNSAPSDDLFWGIQDSSGKYDQWNLHDDGYGIGCETAWTYTTGDPDVSIGVLEDGLWIHHDDLDIAGGFRVEPVFSSPTVCAVDTNIYFSHATENAGIIGATTNNSFGIAGIAGGDSVNAGCSVYDIQVDRLNHSSLFWATALEAATDPLGDYAYDVVSISMALTSYSETLRAAVLFAYSAKSNFVASNGNGTTPPVNYPSGYDDHWLTAVAGADSSGSNMYTSNTNSMLDILAPGEACPAICTPGDQPDSPLIFKNQILSLHVQSSAATPHAAGAIGLLRSYLGNNLRSEDYASILSLSADDPVDCNPQTWNRDYGHGRLDIGKALQNAANHTIYRVSTTNTAVVDSTFVEIAFMSGPYTALTNAIQYKVQGTVQFSPAFNAVPLCWGPGQSPYTVGYHGYSSSLKNYREPFHEVVAASVSADSCNVFTYTYKMWNKTNQAYTDWYPANPNQIPVAVCALGTKTGIKKHEGLPGVQDISISPNPFNAHVSVRYNVKHAGEVVIDVVDVRGVKVRQLHNERAPVGELELTWDGSDDSGRMMASGVYFVRVETAGETSTEKITLAK